ncbi:MAG: protein kinase domain-containing protein, partial [Methylocella sp.]
MVEQFLGRDSGKCYLIEKELGSGGQGTVYLVKDAASATRYYAAKWYKPTNRQDQQQRQIEELVRRGAPTIDDPGVTFYWPIECLSFAGSTSFGYLMKVYDNSKYRKFNEICLGRAKQPKLPVLCRIGYRLAAALEIIHAAGLAYCDINQHNVLIDPGLGEIGVIDNDNVVVNHSTAQVRGVWEFMAPEVALGRTAPNAESDLYSGAVLLYYLWMWEHPMEGKETLKLYSWDILAKKKHFAKQPLFTETFVEGVHAPARRKRLNDWRRLFLELEANAPNCACGAVNVWDGAAKPLNCWKCEREIPMGLCLDVRHTHQGNSILLAQPGANLRRHHLDVARFDARSTEIQASVEPHPKQPGHVILR